MYGKNEWAFLQIKNDVSLVYNYLHLVKNRLECLCCSCSIHICVNSYGVFCLLQNLIIVGHPFQGGLYSFVLSCSCDSCDNGTHTSGVGQGAIQPVCI